MNVPLPNSTQLWNATDNEGRRRLQWKESAGREKTRFNLLVRDMLSAKAQNDYFPRHLKEQDYHLILCALQAGVWESAREVTSVGSDELGDDSTLEDTLVTWQDHLKAWRIGAEEDCQLINNYFASRPSLAQADISDSCLRPITLLVWHLAALKMHAPLDLLQLQGLYNKGQSRAFVPDPRKHLEHWMSSKCPRMALRNAAQLGRIVEKEYSQQDHSPKMMLNPLATPSLLLGAIVVVSYVYHLGDCPGVHDIGKPVHLFDEYEDDTTLQFQYYGVGQPVWGQDENIIVCRCKIPQLVGWFRRLLSRDSKADSKLKMFLVDLASS